MSSSQVVRFPSGTPNSWGDSERALLDKGFIVLHRKFLKWEWYDDITTKIVFLHFLFLANWEQKQWHGVLIPRGTFISSRGIIARTLDLSEQSVRTACHKLKSTGEITIQTTKRYTMYTIVNYDKYQDQSFRLSSKTTRTSTDLQPTINQQLTTTNNINNITIKQINKSLLERFETFWFQYPRKVSKIKTQSTWEKLNLDESTFQVILSALEIQKKSEQWTRDGGQFIPHPTTWLNQRRWEDEVQPSAMDVAFQQLELKTKKSEEENHDEHL